MGRRDDLWSLLFVITDMTVQGVPWRESRQERDACGAMKKEFLADPSQVYSRLPQSVRGPFLRFFAEVNRLSFEDKPDYRLLSQCLQSALDASLALPVSSGPPPPLLSPTPNAVSLAATPSFSGYRGFITVCPVLSCLVLSCLVLSCLVLSCLVLSCLVLSCLVLSCLVLS